MSETKLQFYCKKLSWTREAKVIKHKNHYTVDVILGEEDYLINGIILMPEEIKSLIEEFSNTYINANDNPLASQVIQRMILWNNEQLSRRNSETK